MNSSDPADVRRTLWAAADQLRANSALAPNGTNFFYTVTLPVTLWFLDNGKRGTAREDSVLFIDARHLYRRIDRAHRDLLPEQIELLANIVRLHRRMTATLGGICKAIVDCKHKTAPAGDGYALSIGTRAMKGGRLVIEACKPVSESTYDGWTRRSRPQPGDLILAREAPVGQVVLVPDGRRVCLGQRVHADPQVPSSGSTGQRARPRCRCCRTDRT